jgi:hypothetical protein
LSYHTDHSGESHMITKILTITCAEDIASSVLGDNHLKAIKISAFNLYIFEMNRGHELKYRIELLKRIKSNQDFVVQDEGSTGSSNSFCLHL